MIPSNFKRVEYYRNNLLSCMIAKTEEYDILYKYQLDNQRNDYVYYKGKLLDIVDNDTFDRIRFEDSEGMEHNLVIHYTLKDIINNKEQIRDDGYE